MQFDSSKCKQRAFKRCQLMNRINELDTITPKRNRLDAAKVFYL